MKTVWFVYDALLIRIGAVDGTDEASAMAKAQAVHGAAAFRVVNSNAPYACDECSEGLPCPDETPCP